VILDFGFAIAGDPTRNVFPNRKSKIQNQKSGLSLIEVMIATAILGMGIAGIVAAGAKCLAVARQARNYQIAREAMARVELKNPIQLEEKIENASDSGSLDRPYENFDWRREVEPVGPEDDGLYRITTEIVWTDGSTKGRETIVTYLHRPNDDLPGTAAQ